MDSFNLANQGRFAKFAKQSRYAVLLLVFPILYKTLIRPHLEYCTPAWSRFLVKDMSRIDNVQRRVTEMVTALSDLPYIRRQLETSRLIFIFVENNVPI